jgi:hypothetical protein
MNEFRKFIEPQNNFDEQVFFHRMKGDKDGFAEVTLLNRKSGVRLTVKFNTGQLPYVTEWKMMGEGEYVLGLEPCNVLVKSRKQLREEKSLPFIEPQSTIEKKVIISIEEV